MDKFNVIREAMVFAANWRGVIYVVLFSHKLVQNLYASILQLNLVLQP